MIIIQDNNSNARVPKNWYQLLESLIDDENNTKKQQAVIEAEKNMSMQAKLDAKRRLAKTMEEINERKKNLIKSASAIGLSGITEMVQALARLFTERSEDKRQIMSILTTQSLRREISKIRAAHQENIYLLISMISNSFPVDDYPIYTLNPKTPLYGSEIEISSSGATFLPPLQNDEIVCTLDYLKDNDSGKFYDWVIAILSVDPLRIVDCYRDDYSRARRDLFENISEQIKTDESYQKVIAGIMFRKGDLSRFVHFRVTGAQAEARIKMLDERIKNAEKNHLDEKTNYENALSNINSQNAILREKIEQLNSKLFAYSKLEEQIAEYDKRYQAQCIINEHITLDFQEEIQEKENSVYEMEDKIDQLHTDYEKYKKLYEDANSDLALKNAEIKRLTEDTVAIKEKAKDEILQELLSNLKDQLYYISQYYLELKENGTLDSESIEMFGDTIQNIDSGLYSVGIEKIGSIDEEVRYDSSVHDSMGEKMSNGEKAIICMPGWKIRGEVFSKAQVQKE